MARIRSIKPEFWTNERVMECSVIARLLFVGMWNFADDLGRLPLSAKTLKAQIFPSDDIHSENILGMLKELSDHGLILTYEVDSRSYIQVTGWQHQRIDKPQPAKYPAPQNGFFSTISEAVHGHFDPVQDHSATIPGMVATDGKGEEGKGKDIEPSLREGGASAPPPKVQRETIQKRRSKSKVSLPDDWVLTEQDRGYARQRGFDEQRINSVAEGFSDHHRANGNVMADWAAAWRKWIRNEVEWRGNRNGSGRQRSLQDDSLSVSKAIDRRLATPGTLVFPPRPSLLPVEREDDRRLLPAGRSAES